MKLFIYMSSIKTTEAEQVSFAQYSLSLDCNFEKYYSNQSFSLD